MNEHRNRAPMPAARQPEQPRDEAVEQFARMIYNDRAEKARYKELAETLQFELETTRQALHASEKREAALNEQLRHAQTNNTTITTHARRMCETVARDVQEMERALQKRDVIGEMYKRDMPNDPPRRHVNLSRLADEIGETQATLAEPDERQEFEEALHDLRVWKDNQ